jgi:ketopantoate hydroxymethyltransferase
MSIAEPAAEAAAKPSDAKAEPKKTDGKREKRTITEIRESKKTGEKMVYMSVPDDTSAQWAEMAGVDVAVLGESLAMIAHGHRSIIRYAKLTEVAVNGIMQYVKEVKEGIFPNDDHSYTVNEAEYEKFAAMVAKRRQM